MELTQARVAKYLSYSVVTGELYWIADTNSRGPSKVGQVAGGPNSAGYIVIGICGYRLYAHRLAWLLVCGYMPKEIDHENKEPWNNRWLNLRECSPAQNMAAVHKEALGYEIHGAKYRARIEVDAIRHELGSFDTEDEAMAAYQAARHNLLGEFA